MTKNVNNGVKKIFSNLKAFSLVELIIVIAIVAILSVAGFLTLQKWISQSRDSKRLGDLQTIEKSLTVNYADSDTSELYPIPYKAEETIGDDGETTWYQGYFGSGVVKKLSSLSETPQDPLWTGYEYSVTADQSAFEVYAEMENEKKLSYINRVYADEGLTIAKRGNYEGYLISTDGSNYNLYDPPSIYMYSGSQLVSGDTNYVYKEGESVDVESVVTGVDITGLKDEDESNDGNVYEKVKDSFGLETVEEAEAVVKKAKGGKKIAEEDVDNTTCQTLLESGKTESGVYEIDPDGEGGVAPFEVYCNMETDGGGWIKIIMKDTSSSYSDGNGVIATEQCGGLEGNGYDYPPYYEQISSTIPRDEENEGGMGIRYDIQYENPATNSFFTQEQLNSIREHISTLSKKTRQLTMTNDDDCYPDNRRVILYNNKGEAYDLTPGAGTERDYELGYYWHTSESETTIFGKHWGDGGINKLSSDLILPSEIEFKEMQTNTQLSSCNNEGGTGSCGYGTWGYEKKYALVK